MYCQLGNCPERHAYWKSGCSQTENFRVMVWILLKFFSVSWEPTQIRWNLKFFAFEFFFFFLKRSWNFIQHAHWLVATPCSQFHWIISQSVMYFPAQCPRVNNSSVGQLRFECWLKLDWLHHFSAIIAEFTLAGWWKHKQAKQTNKIHNLFLISKHAHKNYCMHLRTGLRTATHHTCYTSPGGPSHLPQPG